ncbi:hypothetical protein [Citrobacter freundii]|uniref:hypothetical protein n=1 Tax=Citrobacter freundii TaxID=546 RepID=UPI00374FC30D
MRDLILQLSKSSIYSTKPLKDGRNLNRKSLCTKLLCRLEKASGEKEQKHYNALIGLLFE